VIGIFAKAQHALGKAGPMHRGFLGSGSLIVGAFASATLIVVCVASVPVRAENNDISMRRAAERTTFSDDEIKDGFFKTAFRAELQIGRHDERIRKFDEPVRVFVVNRGAPDRRGEIAAIVADIRAHVNHLDVAITDNRQAANFIVTLVNRRDLEPTIRARFGAHAARQIQQKLRPECLSGIAKDQTFRIRRAEAILPVDDGDFLFDDCAYEELLQGLGIINDDGSVPWTMFNDDVQMGFFDVYDQYLLNILYEPRVRPGMTKDQVATLMPHVMPTVRAWVNNNRSRKDAAAGDPTPARTSLSASQH
jgi:hypothetical protein